METLQGQFILGLKSEAFLEFFRKNYFSFNFDFKRFKDMVVFVTKVINAYNLFLKNIVDEFVCKHFEW